MAHFLYVSFGIVFLHLNTQVLPCYFAQVSLLIGLLRKMGSDESYYLGYIRTSLIASYLTLAASASPQTTIKVTCCVFPCALLPHSLLSPLLSYLGSCARAHHRALSGGTVLIDKIRAYFLLLVRSLAKYLLSNSVVS